MLAEHRRLEPTLDALGGWLGGLAQPVFVAMEAMLYWRWLDRQITARGFSVIVAHPYQVKLIWQARSKTDPVDARKLAELARVKLQPAIWIPDPPTRPLRHLLRGRMFLVRQLTVMRNRIDAYLTAENLRCPEMDLYSKAGQAWLATVDLPAVVRAEVTLVLANHALLTTLSQSLDHHINGHGSARRPRGACRRFRHRALPRAWSVRLSPHQATRHPVGGKELPLDR